MIRPKLPSLSTFAGALEGLDRSKQAIALDILEERWREFPHALTEIEQLEDWTHEGLIAAALAPPAPPGSRGEDSSAGPEYTPSYLITLRTLQLVGKLALACEQALHLKDRQTAVQMMRLMSREWTRFKGQLAIEAALSDFGEDAEA